MLRRIVAPQKPETEASFTSYNVAQVILLLGADDTRIFVVQVSFVLHFLLSLLSLSLLPIPLSWFTLQGYSQRCSLTSQTSLLYVL